MATTLSPEEAAQLRTYERQRHDVLAEGYIGFFAPVTALAIVPLLEAVRLRPGMSLLDVPTGSGALAAAATRGGASVIGVDISSGMIAQARKLHPGIDFRVGEVESLPIADGALDAVVCAFGLGHFPYPEASVAECMRTLKPRGRIAFSWWDTSDKQRVQASSATRRPKLAPSRLQCCRLVIPACASATRESSGAFSNVRGLPMSRSRIIARHIWCRTWMRCGMALLLAWPSPPP